MTLLSESDILQRKIALEEALADRQSTLDGEATRRAEGYRYVRPLLAAAESALEAIENTEHRFMLGLDPIDFRTRGFGPKELVFVTGFSHSGKTQLVNTALLNNRDKRILFASMDDPAEMVLIKLVCMYHGVNAEDLERRIKNGDEEAKSMLRRAAQHTFRNLTIVDDSLGLSGLDNAIREFTEYHGAPPQAVFIDYLASLQGENGEDEDSGIRRKAAAVKRWVKDKDFPTVVVHQNSRSRGAPGEPITLLSGGYGGEDTATFIIGVRRKKDDTSLDDGMRKAHTETVTLHLVKNKRPPAKVTGPDGIDFEMTTETGLIRVLRDGLTTAEQAIEARRAA